MKLKERLKELRFERGLTQTNVANALKISNTTMSDYESDKRGKMPSSKILIKMADYFNLTTDYLLGLTDNMFPLHCDKIQLSEKTTIEQYKLIKSFADNVIKSELIIAENRQNLSERLLELRLKACISQKQLADDLGFCNATVSAYEIGTNIPDLETLFSLASYFKVSSDYLLLLSDNPFPIHNKTDKPYVLTLPSAASIWQIKLIQRTAYDIVTSNFRK